MHNPIIRELTTLCRCFHRNSSQNLSYRYRRIQNDVSESSTATIVVGKERRVFHVDRYLLDTRPFKYLMELANSSSSKNKKELVCGSECKGVIFLDLDAILFEHMIWLVSEKCSASACDPNLMLDMREIVDFYSQ